MFVRNNTSDITGTYKARTYLDDVNALVKTCEELKRAAIADKERENVKLYTVGTAAFADLEQALAFAQEHCIALYRKGWRSPLWSPNSVPHSLQTRWLGKRR